MNLKSLLPIKYVKEIGGRAVLFQSIYWHYLAETSAKEAHWSGKQYDPYNIHMCCGYSCLGDSTGRSTNLCKSPPQKS